MDAINENAPQSSLRLKGRRRVAWIVALAASVFFIMLAFNGLKSAPVGSNGPVSTIGKSGDMKSPGGTSYGPYGEK
jgi:hypothetical protein